MKESFVNGGRAIVADDRAAIVTKPRSDSRRSNWQKCRSRIDAGPY